MNIVVTVIHRVVPIACRQLPDQNKSTAGCFFEHKGAKSLAAMTRALRQCPEIPRASAANSVCASWFKPSTDSLRT